VEAWEAVEAPEAPCRDGNASVRALAGVVVMVSSP